MDNELNNNGLNNELDDLQDAVSAEPELNAELTNEPQLGVDGKTESENEPVKEYVSTYDNPVGDLGDYNTEPDSNEPVGTQFIPGTNDANTAPIVDYSSSFVQVARPKASTGIKVFAVILALVIVAASCLTAGYYFGVNSRVGGGSFTAGDLASKPKDTDESTPAQVYEIANKSIVGIACYNSAGEGSTATGVIYTSDGYIVTNDHIYSDIASPKFKIYTHDQTEYDAEYVAGDTRTDIAVLKITGTNDRFDAAVFGNSNECFVGENVVAIGRPMNSNAGSNLTNGIISLLNARVTASNNYSIKSIQTNTAINPGSSGGALFNMYGQVIGITFSKIAGEDYEGIGYAIPSVNVKRVADSLIKSGYVTERARLGISYYDIDSVTADINNIPKGLQVTTVDSASELYNQLKEGDTITHINDIEITTTDLILDIIENSKPGDKVKLTYISTDSNVYTVTTTLLEDTGSSSYIKNESSSENSQTPNNNSEFTFPFGD